MAVAAGAQHTIAVKSNGTLWGWGNNGNGQLGTGNVTKYTAPQQIGTDTDWTMALDTYANHTIAVKKNGTIWAWGYNGFGQLGNDGTYTQQTAPERVKGQLGVTTSGLGSGTITAAGMALTCNSGSAQACMSYGSTVILTATPNGKSSFVEWPGCASVSSTTCTVIATGAAYTVNAKFNDTSDSHLLDLHDPSRVYQTLTERQIHQEHDVAAHVSAQVIRSGYPACGSAKPAKTRAGARSSANPTCHEQELPA